MWKAEEFDGLKPTVYDWARMAAFLDGEGNLNINPIRDKNRKPGVRCQVRILIGNTNPALPVWIRETFGGNIVLRGTNGINPRAKQSYIWSCTAGRAAWVLHNCLPWFLLKEAQAKVLISLQEDIDTTYQGRSRKVSQERLDQRLALKDELHKLNAKGRDNQVVIPVEEL
jgi:hypothetical protein